MEEEKKQNEQPLEAMSVEVLQDELISLQNELARTKKELEEMKRDRDYNQKNYYNSIRKVSTLEEIVKNFAKLFED